MSDGTPFSIDGVIETLGGGRLSSTFRSPEEQDELFRQGKTPLRGGESAHNRGTPSNPGAIDISRIGPGREDEVRTVVEAQTGRKVRKIIWETGRGKNQGTAPHYHIEFDDGTEQNISPNPTSPPRPKSVRDATATPEERARMNQPRQTVGSAFGIKRQQENQEELETRARTSDSVFTQAAQRSNEIREEQISRLEDTVDFKRGINDRIAAGQQELLRLAQPLFARRREIATRRKEISGMNPLEAALKGAFNPNYNSESLDGADRAIVGELDVLSQEHNFLTELLTGMNAIAQGNFNDQNALAEAQIADLSEDARAALMSFQSQSNVIAAELQGLSTDATLIQAQQLQKAQVMNDLTDGQLAEALGMAEESELGVASVNGVDLGVQELREMTTARDRINYNMRAMELAVQAQDEEMRSRAETNLIESMTRPQIEQAIRDGGEFNGQKLDIVQLQNRRVQLETIDAHTVANIHSQQAATMFKPLVENWGERYLGSMERMNQVFGEVPLAYSQLGQQGAMRIRQLTQGLRAAEAAGTQEDYLVSALPEIQALQSQQAEMISGLAKQWAGGNDDAEAVALGWINGTAIDPKQAMGGLIHFARHGLPKGVKLEGPSAQIFAIVEAEVSAFNRIQQGESPIRGSQTDRENFLRDRIRNRIAGEYANQVLNNAIMDLPRLAQGTDFGKIPIDTWRNAVQIGDRRGLENAATQFHLTPAQVQEVLNGGPGAEAALATAQRTKPGLTAATIGEFVSAQQTKLTMDALDASRGALGFVPSRAFAQFIGSPQARNAISGMAASDGLSSFGGFVVSQASTGAINTSLSNYQSLVQSTLATRVQDDLMTRADKGRQIASDPLARAEFLMGGIDGLTDQQVKVMMRYLEGRLNESPEFPHLIGDPIQNANANRILDAIISQESGDPNIEPLRKKIAPRWRELNKTSGAMLDQYFGR